MAVEVTLKKWGNSMGVILPKQVIENQGIKENDKIFILIAKKIDFSKSFGSAPKRTMTGQQFKNMVRKGWN